MRTGGFSAEKKLRTNKKFKFILGNTYVRLLIVIISFTNCNSEYQTQIKAPPHLLLLLLLLRMMCSTDPTEPINSREAAAAAAAGSRYDWDWGV